MENEVSNTINEINISSKSTNKIWLPDHGPRVWIYLFQVILPLFMFIAGMFLYFKLPLLIESPDLNRIKIAEILKSKDLHLGVTSVVSDLSNTKSAIVVLSSLLGMFMCLIGLTEALCLSIGSTGPISFLHKVEKRKFYKIYKNGDSFSLRNKLTRAILSKGIFLFLILFIILLSSVKYFASLDSLSILIKICSALFGLFVLAQIFFIESHPKGRAIHDYALGLWKLQSDSDDVSYSDINLDHVRYQKEYDSSNQK